MPGQLIELFNSRNEVIGQKPTAEFNYVAIGCADEVEVRAIAAGGAPATYNGMVRRTIEIADRIGNDAWKLVVRYDSPSPIDEDVPEPTIAFDSTGGTQHITQSLLTIGRYGPAASTELGGAIGYDGDNVAGVDITIPVWNWQETHYLTDAQLNSNVYYALTGMVNSDGFRGYQPGEVLFLGASGQKRGTEKWEITFKFAASPNLMNLTVGTIVNISKRGWDYMWVQYGEDVDSSANVKIKKPIAVYVEKVYDEGPFSSLGI